MRLSSWLWEHLGGGRPTPLVGRLRAKGRPAPRWQPRLEALEDRSVPSTLRVNHDFNVHVAADAAAQHGTLDWAVANAHSGDTILLTADAARTGIMLAHGEMVLTQQNLTITTEAGAPPVTINAQNLSRVFEVASGASITMVNLVITGGNAYSPGGLSNSVGGGILVDAGASLALSGCAVSGNGTGSLSVYDGGGIANAGTVTITDSDVSNNFATVGGGISNSGTIMISHSTVSGNIAFLGDGGGILTNGTLTIMGSTVSGNDADTGGGIENFGTLTVAGSSVTGNGRFDCGRGGGIENFGGTSTITSSTVSGNGNGGCFGGGIDIQGGGTVTVEAGSVITGNSAGFGTDVFIFGPATNTFFFLEGNSAIGDAVNMGTIYQDGSSTIGHLDGNAAILI
jgi:hypothetical protein